MTMTKKEARRESWGPGASKRQEAANAWTHGMAAIASALGMGPLIALAAIKGNARHVVGFSIFGAALTFLFTASTLMHLHREEGPFKKIYEFLDYAGIYLLIAGTYTPFCLVTLHGAWGWSLFGVEWGLAIVGILLSLFIGERFDRYSLGIYLMMGWLVVLALRPLAHELSLPGLALLMGGGLAYTIGAIVLSTERILHSHAVWHLFVGLGALLHILALIFYVLPDMH
jgi:hemolysin III